MYKYTYPREIKYTKTTILPNHKSANCYELKYNAIDGSNIYAELFIPKNKVNGIVIELPDYRVPPKDYLNLSRYAIHNLVVVSLHIRGQAGKSTNNLPMSIYAPYLSNNDDEELYYNLVYQDVLDLISIIKKEFDNLPIYTLGIGQGGTLGLVAGALTKDINIVFASNAMLCDFEETYYSNGDVGVYAPIREYARNYVNKENFMLEKLREIDVLAFAENINAKVHYGISKINPRTPIKAQENVLAKIKNVTVVPYRKFEHEHLQEQFFDEYVLEVLASI